MDNHSIPSIADALFASSNDIRQLKSILSSSKKHVPNDLEMVFIDTLRNIKGGRICSHKQLDPSLSNQWREIAEGLLDTMQINGIDGFWAAYTVVSYDSPQLKT